MKIFLLLLSLGLSFTLMANGIDNASGIAPLTLLLSFFAASLAGLVAGLLGGGVGLILIPTLVYILSAKGLPEDAIMHVSIAVTVAAISIIGTIGSYSHHKQHTVNWQKVKIMIPGLITGIIIGSLLANKLSSNYLILIFGIFVLLLAAYTWFVKDQEIVPAVYKNKVYQGMALIIGFVGSVFGVSPIAVPFFRRTGMEMKTAIGTGLVLGTLMAYGITVMYIITGWKVNGLPAYSTGYVDWALAIPIAIASSLFAPLGAKLAFRLPKKMLKLLYTILLVAVSIHMISTALGH